MFNWLKTIFASPEIVEFASTFGMEESVARLKSATRQSMFGSLAKQEAVGTVKQNRVSLYRVIPMVQNSFKPVFRGRFVERDGKVILTGRFSMHLLVKIFMTIWFGGVIFGCLGAIATEIAKPNPAQAPFQLIPFGMLAAAIAMIRVGKWFARNDEAWLSNVISRALGQTSDAGQAPDSDKPTQQRPMVLKVVSGVLCLSAAMALFFSFAGPQFAATGGGLGAMHQLPALYSGNLAIAYGVFMLVLAYGVFKRHMLAWRAGLALIALGWAYSVFDLFTRFGDESVPMPPVIQYVFAAFSAIVMLIWWRWWYAQRIHFLKMDEH